MPVTFDKESRNFKCKGDVTDVEKYSLMTKTTRKQFK